jgi:ABC-2 type transport system permease protein
MKKIRTIVRKEFTEIFKNRMVVFTVIFLPLMLTAIPLAILIGLGGQSGANNMMAEMPPQFSALCPKGLAVGDCFLVYMVSQFMIMFMIVPLAIPSTIAAYSIVGEKTTRSLEPLLATPITTAELLIGKSLSALIPAVAATDVAFLIFAVGAWIIVPNKLLLSALLDARWLIAVFIVGPLMALMSVNVTMMVSARVNDPRVAEQISMVIILPVLAFFFAQLSGLFILNQQVILWVALILVLLDGLLINLSIHSFQRETILTRWK